MLHQVRWFNEECLHSSLGYVSPSEDTLHIQAKVRPKKDAE